MGVRRGLLWVAGVLSALAVLAAPAVAGAERPLKLEIPKLNGKNKVGTRSFQLVDRSRPAGFDQTGKRRLMVQVTYPRRRRVRRCRPAPYLPNGTARRLLSYLALEGPVAIDTRTCLGGPVVKRRLPLIVFSHAYTADRAVYTSLVADLASRGFVVVSIDHTSDAFAVQFPSGRVIDGVYGSPLASKPVTEPELMRLINVRVRDVRFVTTWVLRQNRLRRSWLRHRINPRRIGIFGHSLGGATAAQVAAVDRRFRASADLDGSLFGRWPLTFRSHQPFLLFTAEDGLGAVQRQDKSCWFFRHARWPKLAWQLVGAKHLSFSDFQVLAPQIASREPDWPYAGLYKIITGDLNPVGSVLSQRNAIARFFRTYLRGPRRLARRVKPPSPPAGVVRVPRKQFACADPD